MSEEIEDLRERVERLGTGGVAVVSARLARAALDEIDRLRRLIETAPDRARQAGGDCSACGDLTGMPTKVYRTPEHNGVDAYPADTRLCDACAYELAEQLQEWAEKERAHARDCGAAVPGDGAGEDDGDLAGLDLASIGAEVRTLIDTSDAIVLDAREDAQGGSLAKLRALLDAATPGPWIAQGFGRHDHNVRTTREGWPDDPVAHFGANVSNAANDAHAIAALRNLAPELLAVTEALGKVQRCPLCYRWTGPMRTPHGRPMDPEPHDPNCEIAALNARAEEVLDG